MGIGCLLTGGANVYNAQQIKILNLLFIHYSRLHYSDSPWEWSGKEWKRCLNEQATSNSAIKRPQSIFNYSLLFWAKVNATIVQSHLISYNNHWEFNLVLLLFIFLNYILNKRWVNWMTVIFQFSIFPRHNYYQTHFPYRISVKNIFLSVNQFLHLWFLS